MKWKRIGGLTAGGDPPALNATIFGIVEAANRPDLEVIGLLHGDASLSVNQSPTVDVACRRALHRANHLSTSVFC